MKKLVLIVLILILSLAFFVACDNSKNENTQQITVNIILGTNGKINWLYESRVGISPIDENHKVTFCVDINDFLTLEDIMPKNDEIDSPRDYYFSGWYFEEYNKNSTTNFDQTNWDERVKRAKNGIVNIYATWLPKTSVGIRFDLGDSGAYFFYDNPDYDSTSRTWVEINVFVRNNNSVEQSMPSAYFIAVPDGIRFDGWYFEDGSEVTTENARLQTPNADGYVKAIPHWTTNLIVYYNCYFNEYETGFPYKCRIVQKDSAQMSGTVLENDFEGLLAALPKREDFEVEKVDYSVSQRIILQESFPVFEWKITSFDHGGLSGERKDLTEENWRQALEESKTKTVRLILYYEFADVNQNITLVCYPQIPGGLTFTDDALAKYGAEYGDIIIVVARNDFSSLFALLPTVEDICQLTYVDGEPVKTPIAIESITWKIAIQGIDWNYRTKDALVDLTEENWIEYTKHHNAIYLSFTYVLKYDDSPMDLFLSNSWIDIGDKEYELKYKELPDDRFVWLSSSRLSTTIARNGYDTLISTLPTYNEVELTLYTNGGYVDCDKTIKAIVWKIVTGGYNGLENEYELNESNYEYVAKHSRNMQLKAYFELND